MRSWAASPAFDRLVSWWGRVSETQEAGTAELLAWHLSCLEGMGPYVGKIAIVAMHVAGILRDLEVCPVGPASTRVALSMLKRSPALLSGQNGVWPHDMAPRKFVVLGVIGELVAQVNRRL